MQIKCPKQHALDVNKCIDRTTRGIRAAIKHCAEYTDGKKVDDLRYDIRNAPYHAFGKHSGCRNYFCTIDEGKTDANRNLIPETNRGDDTDSTKDLISELERCGVWNKILVIVEKIAAKAEFINLNKTSNL